MGLKIMFTVVATATIFILPSYLRAEWKAPQTIISSSWGKGEGQFDKAEYDTDYDVPDIAAILPNKTVLIHDTVNWKMMVFKEEGKFEKDVYWQQVVSDQGEKVMQLPEYWIEDIKRFTINGNFYIEAGNGAEVLSSVGEHLATYDEKPLELGKVAYYRRAASDNKYDTIVQYEDITYRVLLDKKWRNYVRDQNDYLYFYDSYTMHDPVTDDTTLAWFVAKFDPCGKRIAKFMMPVSEYEPLTPEQGDMPVSIRNEVRNEYGPPVIGPDGSVYAYKRTPDTYSILKWEWVDDPADPQPGPDAPANLKLTPSQNGLYLTWAASPQDPGCVDSYELQRATSAGGISTSLTTTDPGVLKFNDSAALSSSSYFYKVRAKSGGLYSPYSPAVSGSR